MDVLYIKILDKFDVDLCLTFINFQSSTRSNGLKTATHILNTITHQKLPISCYNFTNVHHIKIIRRTFKLADGLVEFTRIKSWSHLVRLDSCYETIDPIR